MENTTPNKLCGIFVSKDEVVYVGSCESSKGVTVAIVDANTVIEHCDELSVCVDRFVTTSEVTNQIPPSSFLPYTEEPSPDSVEKVISFARQSGFLRRLSEADIKVIALTYTLESVRYGSKHLQDTPIASNITLGSHENWMIRAVSQSSIACVSTNFAVQYMIMQMGLRLVAPKYGKQIYETLRLVLKCDVCATMTIEMGRVNCHICGNGVALCRIDVTILENRVHDHVLVSTPENRNKKDDDNIQTTNLWQNLPQDLLDFIRSKLYFTDRIRLGKMCKDWRLPIISQAANELPMIIRFDFSGNEFSEMTLLDPVHKRTHRIWDSGSIYSDLLGNSSPIGTKNGWVTFRMLHKGKYIRLFWFNVF